jgi:hypothetical protein
MTNASETDKISAAIPTQLHVDLERSARENDRSMSAELRRALVDYLEPFLSSHESGSGGRGASLGSSSPLDGDGALRATVTKGSTALTTDPVVRAHGEYWK